ncbi:serpentine type 7TM GPCR chemoreceptor srt domain-containing protein [Ditylenchus destructor]|nr:serpentine type 7TM GPCR chemoreceptor srt domain-containing protein [Ditylenchus destructor]
MHIRHLETHKAIMLQTDVLHWCNGLLVFVRKCLFHWILFNHWTSFLLKSHLNYWVGLIGAFLWVIESSADVILAFNRCIEVTSPTVAVSLFKGNRTWYWLIPISLYSLSFSYFTKPLTFSSLFVCYFFNPHAGYIDDFGEAIYSNKFHAFHNMLIFFGVTGLYVVFVIVMATKVFSVRGFSSLTLVQRVTFFQVLAISFFNGYAAGLCVYYEFVPITQFWIYTATYSWTTAHGLPGVIYIALNKTIRDDCIRMFRRNFKFKDAKTNVYSAKIVPAITGTGATESVNVKE